MPLRVIAIVAEAVTSRSCLDAALAAAAADDTAEIEAFHVKVDPDKIIVAPEEISIQQMRVRMEGTAEARAAAVRAIYQAWHQRLPPEIAARTSWKEVVGTEQASVAREAKSADLLVTGRPHNLDGGGALIAATFESHRPLLVPPEWMPARVDGFGRHMAVAWKPEARAHRAIEGAGLWLRRAERVSLIMIAKDLESGGWPEAERLARMIGFKPEPHLIAPRGGEVGEQLLDAVKALRADAMVLGAHRHNSMIIWAFPSTTRYLIKHTRIPLFLAH
jgi:hypothetical protein